MKEEEKNVGQPEESIQQLKISTSEEIVEQQEIQNTEKKISNSNNKRKNKAIIYVLLIMITAIIGCGAYMIINSKKEEQPKTDTTESEAEQKKSAYYISGNSLEKFDLYFLQLENKQENKLYSPLSIKYALEMLAEGSKGETKTQIDSVIGEYAAKKYNNSKNISFANAMFIRDTYKNRILPSYTEKLASKYNAEIIYDSFANANNMNKWVSNKTFKLIDGLFDNESVSKENFALVNALAIDMEWTKKIQLTTKDNYEDRYDVKYKHEDFKHAIHVIGDMYGYKSIKFDNNKTNAKTVEIGAAINNYDIVKELGEDNIRNTVTAEYKKWLTTNRYKETEPNIKNYIDKHIEELNSNYKQFTASTDFYLYDDDNVKTFAKDLKEYDGTTLQYIGIMPKQTTLEDYIKNIDVNNINNIISNLKEIKNENFKEGVVTQIVGDIPLFKFDYTLDLKEDLKQLGITNVFDIDKADLSEIISDEKQYIDSVSHKANIEFSNEGIKAAAATQIGGAGDVSAGFEYLYKVPVEKIDLTFDKPYFFLIRDKKSGEIWFTGTVYTPVEGEFAK